MRTRTAIAMTGVTAVGALTLAYTTIASLGASPSQAAEGFQWFWTFDGPISADSGNEIVSDDEGNIFIAGTHGGLDFDRDGLAVDLSWSGATSADIDVYRVGVLLATVANTGAHADTIPRGSIRGNRTYRVCEAGTRTCSNESGP
ncbi:MAG: hypothetical protein ACYTA3_14760 [Planctomycetota bacterium]|jgi:hypothetical protein